MGCPVDRAAATSGVALRTARDWYRASGGVNPYSVKPTIPTSPVDTATGSQPKKPPLDKLDCCGDLGQWTLLK